MYILFAKFCKFIPLETVLAVIQTNSFWKVIDIDHVISKSLDMQSSL